MTHLTTPDRTVKAWQRLLDIMEELRKQCPWNSKQTLESLRYLTINKTDELSEAILASNREAIKQKLGDLMWHMVFYSKIAAEQNAFDIGDVINGVCDKLIVHHPPIHTMASEAASPHHDNLSTHPKKAPNQSQLSDIQASLPALIRALRLQEQAHRIGFDWPNQAEVWEKVEEEIRELKQCQESAANQEQIENEFGDLLFSLVNYARFIHIDPELALEKTTKKFINRFHYMEQAAQRDGKELLNLSLAEMDAYWNEAKNNLII